MLAKVISVEFFSNVLQLTGVDPGFSRFGSPTPKEVKPTFWTIVHLKLHEIEDILARGGCKGYSWIRQWVSRIFWFLSFTKIMTCDDEEKVALKAFNLRYGWRHFNVLDSVASFNVFYNSRHFMQNLSHPTPFVSRVVSVAPPLPLNSIP